MLHSELGFHMPDSYFLLLFPEKKIFNPLTKVFFCHFNDALGDKIENVFSWKPQHCMSFQLFIFKY